MSTSKERLLQFIEYKGISKRKFYEKCGLSNAFLDKVGSIGADKLESISIVYPELNVEWVITGRGPMLKEQLPKAQPAADGIPLIPAEALAGKGKLVIEEYMIEQRYNIPDFRGAECLIRVKGDSMVPTYLPGDIIAIKRIDSKIFIEWNKPHILDTVQGILIKRVLQSDSGYILKSDNPEYPDISVPIDAVQSMYVIIGLIRVQ